MHAFEAFHFNGAASSPNCGLEVVGVHSDDPKAAIYKALIWAAATLGAISVSLEAFVLKEIYMLHAQVQVVDARTAPDTARVQELAVQIGRLQSDVARLSALVEVRRQ